MLLPVDEMGEEEYKDFNSEISQEERTCYDDDYTGFMLSRVRPQPDVEDIEDRLLIEASLTFGEEEKKDNSMNSILCNFFQVEHTKSDRDNEAQILIVEDNIFSAYAFISIL